MSNCRVLGGTARRLENNGGLIESDAAEIALQGSGASAGGHARDRLRTWQKAAIVRALLMGHTLARYPRRSKRP